MTGKEPIYYVYIWVAPAVFKRMTRRSRALTAPHTWQLVYVLVYYTYHNIICFWCHKASRATRERGDVGDRCAVVRREVDEKRRTACGGWSPAKGGMRQGWGSVRPDIRYLRAVLIRSCGSVARECRNILLLHACAHDIYRYI